MFPFQNSESEALCEIGFHAVELEVDVLFELADILVFGLHMLFQISSLVESVAVRSGSAL